MDTKNFYHKRSNSTGNIYSIITLVADARDAVVNKADETIDADNFKLDVNSNMNITQHRSYLISVARPFKSAPYRSGPKTSEL